MQKNSYCAGSMWKCHRLFAKIGPRIPILITLYLLSYGCAMVGPASLKDGRTRYNQTVAFTDTQEMLKNLVKLKYRDKLTFLQVSSITMNLQLSATAGAQIPMGSSKNYAGNIIPFSAGIIYAENPTVTYTPLRGEAFVKQMLTPIPMKTLILLFQAGWPIDTVFRLVVEEVNDVENASSASGPTPEQEPVFQKFLEIASLFGDLQRRRVLEWAAIDKPGQPAMMYIHPDLTLDEKKTVKRVKSLLKLSHHGAKMEGYEVGYGIRFTGPGRLNIVTRSMTDILFYAAQAVNSPPSHIENGLVTVTRKPNRKPFNWGDLHREQIKIKWSASRPSDAYIAVAYRGYWFYIEDRDLHSKSTFLLLQILADLQAGTKKPSAVPVLTLPVG